jgi:hypothetical protein
MDPSHVNYHYDYLQREQSDRWNAFNLADPHSSELNLQRHDLFPGYVHNKPLSLNK